MLKLRYLISSLEVSRMLSVSTSSLILAHSSPLNCSRKASLRLTSNTLKRTLTYTAKTSVLLEHKSFTYLASSILRFSSAILCFSALISDVDISPSICLMTSFRTVSSSLSVTLRDKHGVRFYTS